SLSPGTAGPSRDPGEASVGSRHVDLPGLPGEVFPELEHADAQAEERDAGHREEPENREIAEAAEPGLDPLQFGAGKEEPTGQVEPVRQRDDLPHVLKDSREHRQGKEDPTEYVEDSGDGL